MKSEETGLLIASSQCVHYSSCLNLLPCPKLLSLATPAILPTGRAETARLYPAKRKYPHYVSSVRHARHRRVALFRRGHTDVWLSPRHSTSSRSFPLSVLAHWKAQPPPSGPTLVAPAPGETPLVIQIIVGYDAGFLSFPFVDELTSHGHFHLVNYTGLTPPVVPSSPNAQPKVTLFPLGQSLGEAPGVYNFADGTRDKRLQISMPLGVAVNFTLADAVNRRARLVGYLDTARRMARHFLPAMGSFLGPLMRHLSHRGPQTSHQ